MSTWIVGDVHGHYAALKRLLSAINFTASDSIIFVGDLVNGGGTSGDVVRWCADHDAAVTLGNHDLHMLAVWSGARERRKKDDFNDLLDAADAPELVAWLRGRSLTRAVPEHNTIVVHAGLLPSWTVADAVRIGGEVEAMLRSESHMDFFPEMYGNKPPRWKEEHEGAKRLRCAINGLTRMRIVDHEGRMEFDFSSVYRKIPTKWRAWFDHPDRQTRGTFVVFGHWSALGVRSWPESNVVCLDGGVRWGRELAAMRLEDRHIVTVSGR